MDFIGGLIAFIVKFPFIVIGWIIVGMIAGDLARRFTGASDKSGFSDFILGIAGAVIGGLLAGLMGLDGPIGGIGLVIFNLVIATVGAMVISFIWQRFFGKGKARSKS